MRNPVLASLLLLGLAVAAHAQDKPPTPPPAQPPAPPTPAPPAPPAPAPPAPQPDHPPAPPPGGPPAASAGVDWFPLEGTRRWKYRVKLSVESTSADEEALPPEPPHDHSLEVSVVGPTTLEGKPVIEVQWKVDQDLAMRDFYEVDQGVVYCLKRIQGFGEHMKEYTFEHRQATARQDMAVGSTWTWEGKTGSTQGTQTFKVVRQERIDTPAGTFDALVLQIEFQGEDESRGTTTRWLARGVGIVKEVSEIRTPSQVFRTEGNLDRTARE